MELLQFYYSAARDIDFADVTTISPEILNSVVAESDCP
jgi:hypothetical protein